MSSLIHPFTFSRFTVCPARREFLVDGIPVELGGRNYDVLLALIEARGAVVSKNELMNRAWPKRVVEDGNLHASISRLRRLLGSDRGLIRTVCGRGYRFTGTLQMPVEPTTASRTGLPTGSGRDELLAQLGRLVLEGISSRGGAAHKPAAHAADGAWLLGFALVPSAVAGALGLSADGGPAAAISSLTAPGQDFAKAR